MKIVSSNEMKMLDNKTIEKIGIDSLVLMERAGLMVVQILKKYFDDLSEKKIVVVCGKGNNGGDGLVVARELMNYTNDVLVILMDEFSTKESETNFKVYLNSGGKYVKFEKNNIELIERVIAESDIVVDAIFGIGLTKPVIGDYKTVIEVINRLSKFTVAVDIASGLSSNSGKIMGTSVKADLTVTFEFPKIGHFINSGKKLSGELEVVKIGIPKKIINENIFNKYVITSSLITIPKREVESNKGTYGKVIVIGGSKEFFGAPLLSTLGALRSGVGKAIICAPKTVVLNAINYEPGLIPCVIDDEYFSQKHVLQILSLEDEKTVYVLGPGIGRKKETKEFIDTFVNNTDKPIVVDADAIVLLSENRESIKGRENIVLTPHPGEFSQFLKLPLDEVKYNYELVKKIAKELKVIINLKDSTSIISDGDKIFFNICGNSSLSKGGSGDILSGLIAGFIAQGLTLLESTITASYVLGKAAELYRPEGRNFISEIVNLIPKVIEAILKEKEEINGNIPRI
ncbi:bifunctional ADP-dependent NAD(P)H-hydrate dehydratase/NAD(P)H-hydrate epimerase [Thermosipho atlanticus]|uniref:Bifunctional NAD(P)H-hydrate repair enzyme n=1 Tax=Thermosipho atlanticus DSM 15807 TaxID=1123380 RepID=A0A1M5SQ63_9BACT|nr:bifunctional ADP-dependent NAD(P)H-hydrate dehydratase/NAD(P)H-hydrate epimerase [Thermosipho atlanticus]SHH40547.1 NAD(P)H-hydrate epimerase [Thermosipho atlanticus DSM 15807]